MAAVKIGLYLTLILAAGVLVYAAIRDFRSYSIPNEVTLLLGALYLVQAWLLGSWTELYHDAAFAAFMFSMLLFCYWKNWVGGGDVKLLGVAFLWAGIACALPFSVLLLIFASLHALAGKLNWVDLQHAQGRSKLPFAPSIAAALIISLVVCPKGPA